MYPQFQATKRFELIEIQIPANSTTTKFPIPDQPELRDDSEQDIIIQAIETWSAVSTPFTRGNTAVITAADFLKCYLTLYIDGEISQDGMPFAMLRRIEEISAATIQPFARQMFKTRNIRIDWAKSYIQTNSAFSAGANTLFSILLGVHYYKLPPGTVPKIEAKELDMFQNP